MGVSESCFTDSEPLTTSTSLKPSHFPAASGSIFFLDMYHPKKSRIAPDGFRLSPKACQFSGFHHPCADFPYDFIEMKRREGLGPAYMPTVDILHGHKIQGLRAARGSHGATGTSQGGHEPLDAG